MILISTNMYRPNSFMKVLKVLEPFNKKIGIELFPMFHDPKFEKILKENLDTLKNYEFSFHGPYYKTEHSAIKGSPSYNESMMYFNKCLEYAEVLNPKYIVFHHNNVKVTLKDEMIKNSINNLNELSKISKVPLLIENVGIKTYGNMLFDEEEFIGICNSSQENVLIDIGHSNANRWDMENLIISLKDKIKAFHLHSNDGVNDNHYKIFENTPDIYEFINLYKKYTPEADLVLEYNHGYEDREEILVEDVKRLMQLL